MKWRDLFGSSPDNSVTLREYVATHVPTVQEKTLTALVSTNEALEKSTGVIKEIGDKVQLLIGRVESLTSELNWYRKNSPVHPPLSGGDG